jgi:hypothetical protein
MTTIPLLDGEKADLAEEAQDVLGEYADGWLDAPVTVQPESGEFVTRRDLIAKDDPSLNEQFRDELRRIKYGLFS